MIIQSANDSCWRQLRKCSRWAGKNIHFQ